MKASCKKIITLYARNPWYSASDMMVKKYRPVELNKEQRQKLVAQLLADIDAHDNRETGVLEQVMKANLFK